METLNDQVKAAVERTWKAGGEHLPPGTHLRVIAMLDVVAAEIQRICREDAQRREEEAVKFGMRAGSSIEHNESDIDTPWEELESRVLAAYKSHKVSESDTIRSRKEQEGEMK